MSEQEGNSEDHKPTSASDPTRAQKIMAGGDITQNVSHRSETNVFNQDETRKVLQCVVSGRSAVITEGGTCRMCQKWAHKDYLNFENQLCQTCEQNESVDKEKSYRDLVSEFLRDDHILDPIERDQLDKKASELGLSLDMKKKIEDEERKKDASSDEKMSPRDKSKFNRAYNCFFVEGNPKMAFSNIEGLQDAYPNNQEVGELYVLISVEADPARGLSFINRNPVFRADSPLKSIRMIELHESMGNENDASREERTALRGFGEHALVQAKALERLIDLFYNDKQEQYQADAVRAEAKNFKKPQPIDDPYLHFVQAYLDSFLGARKNLSPKNEHDLAKPYLLRKQRQLRKKTKSVEADAESIKQIEKLIGKVEALNKKLGSEKEEPQPPTVSKKVEATPQTELKKEAIHQKIPTNGHGKFTFKSGDTFEGVWRNGRIFNGKYQFSDGARYEGEFNEKGQFHGQGKFTHAKGTVEDGLWTNGKFAGALPPSDRTHIDPSLGGLAKKKKNRLLAVLLVTFFGPLGSYYISFKNGLLMTFLFFVAVFILFYLDTNSYIPESDVPTYLLGFWAYLIWDNFSAAAKTQK